MVNIILKELLQIKEASPCRGNLNDLTILWRVIRKKIRLTRYNFATISIVKIINWIITNDSNVVYMRRHCVSTSLVWRSGTVILENNLEAISEIQDEYTP
jgi:hypothetical protein